jgi:mRNA interferase RelE/StbE
VASYNLFIKPSAAKELEVLPTKDRRKVITKIQALAGEPRLHGCEKLSGQEQYRIRQGHYRVVYEIDDAAQTVLIVKVGHRRDVYR